MGTRALAKHELKKLTNDILDGYLLSFGEAQMIYDAPNIETSDLVAAAKVVRDKFCGDKIDLCSIVNAKSGMCEHNCSYCAQSSRSTTNVETYPMKSAAEILVHAKAAENAGAHRFCIVTSGGQLNDEELEIATQAISLIKEQTGLMRCASLGTLTGKGLKQLIEAGLDRYHHNVETAKSFYSNVCTTQDYSQKINTIRAVKEQGLQLCVGGIFNLGESADHRLQMAFEIRELDPDSVPLNFLNPRPGTPLENRQPMDIFEAIRMIALYRLIMPKPVIRLAAGRCETLGCMQEKAAEAGINGLLIGDYLTTRGPNTKKDLAMLIKLGFNVKVAK